MKTRYSYYRLATCMLMACVLVSFCGCKYFDNIRTKIRIKYEFGKTIDFSWPGYEVLSDTLLNGFEISKPLTIVTHINQQLCSSCFGGYLKAAEQYVNFFKSDSIQMVCIAYPRSVDEIQDALSFAGVSPEKVRVVYDIEDLYLSSNSIDYLESGDNAFLLDRNHRILLIGDPVRFHSINEVYTSTIISMLRNNE